MEVVGEVGYPTVVNLIEDLEHGLRVLANTGNSHGLRVHDGGS